MTPFALKLQNELENEYVRMDHEWFFPWHGYNVEGRVVEVETFGGGPKTHLGGGGEFGGTSSELVYWTAIARYLRNKVSDVFDLADAEIRSTSPTSAATIAEETARVLNSFCHRIFFHAVETAKAVKGRGYPDAQYMPPNVEKDNFAALIEQRKNALISFYNANERAGWFTRLETWCNSNKGKLTLAGISIAVLALLFNILG